MAFTAELERVQTMNAQKVAEEHNAMIKERYRRLQDAEADQFANSTENYNAQPTVRASVLAPEAPVYTNAPAMEQTPQVTEFVRARIETPVFTTEKFNGVNQAEAAATIVTPAPVAAMPVQIYAPAETASAATETQYTFSAMAKKMLVAFAATATVMISIIGINTGIINRNNARLENLNQQTQTLMQENQELQNRIENATSEETIYEYAQQNGMIKG